jgi:hypothetical protein
MIPQASAMVQNFALHSLQSRSEAFGTSKESQRGFGCWL